MSRPQLPPVAGRLAAAALAVVAAFGAAPCLQAQVRQSPTLAESFTLAFPSATVSAIGSRSGSGGVTWDLVRRGGLSLSVMGRGEFTVSVVALVVAQGRITRAWTSPRRQVAAGTVALPGSDFLPDSRFLDGVPNVLGEQAGLTASIDVARKAAVVGGDATALLGKAGSTASGVVFVLVPEGASRSSTTNPRFARTETMSD